MFQVLDNCSRADSWESIPTASTCLLLPLTDVCSNDSTDALSKFMTGSSADTFFVKDAVSGLLRLRTRYESTCPRVVSRLRSMILNHRIQLLPFFVVHQLHPVIDDGLPDMTSILYRLQHDGTSILCLLPRAIKAMLIHNMLLAQDCLPMPDIPSSRWRSFLAARMLSTTRNLWYRLIVAKLSDRATLSRIIPATVTSPLCHYCGQTETAAHLLFKCPHKADVWNAIDSTYLVTPTGTSSQRLFTDISFLQFSHCDPAPILSLLATFDVVSVVLTAIWSSHWNDHFNHVPFSSPNILQII